MSKTDLGIFKNKTILDYFWLGPVFIWVALFLAASNVAMIFSGDSIEYLEMANQLNKGSFPKSNMWMPLYPFMIWLTSKIFFVDLIIGVKLYHLILTTLFTFAYNKYFVMKQSINFLERLILNIPLFGYLNFIEESITIMAECQFLILTIVNLYFIKLIFEKKSIAYIYWSVTIVILSILTKYNGFVNLGLLFIIIMYTFSITKAVKYVVLSSLAVGLFYMTWLYYKPGGDFLVGAVNVESADFLKVFSEISADIIYSFSKYFLPYRLNEIFQNFMGVKMAALLFNSAFLIVLVIIGYKLFQRRLSLNTVLILYCILYIVLLVMRQLPLGKNETNSRTIYYVLFLSTYLISYITIKQKSLLIKIILFIIPLLSLAKVVNSLPAMINVGNGSLANPAYQINSTLTTSMLSLKDSMGLKANQIYSNEHKILSLFTNYNKVSELPKSQVFAGNTYLPNDNFNVDFENFTDQISNEKFLVVYVKLSIDHPRYDSLLNTQVFGLCKNGEYSFIEDEYSYLLWSKNKK